MNKDNYLPLPPKSMYLPTSREEMVQLGWEQADIIIFSGDAYVDHPSFGAAVIGRMLQKHGYKVAIVPQPNWRDDLRDFKKLGKPRLFFGVSAGAMDSMVNHYTANRRLRHDDAYTPGGRHGMRPDYPTIVYSEILKKLYPDVPIIAGGIEASLRRVSHYDYWQDRLRPSILADAHADMIVYGMGERSLVEIAKRLEMGQKISQITDIPQSVFFADEIPAEEHILLSSYEECLADKKKQAFNFKHVEVESNKYAGKIILQKTKDKYVQINPMYPPMTSDEIDQSFDLPFTRLPHPRYRGKHIPAYEMIKHSINMHRGCFGGCAFCTISAHQGKFIASRSKKSILAEAEKVIKMPDFKGYISDLGGPSANMYAMRGKDTSVCKKCARPSCLHPSPCKNLNTDHSALLEIYKEVDKLPGMKKSFIGSGVRYDLAMAPTDNKKVESANRKYIEELIKNHVSGRLKVAPEHTSDKVLNQMRKPSFSQFRKFKRIFDDINKREGMKQQIIPYFISSHPGCEEEDMAELACITKNLDFKLEQIQDFTPTPMTVATEIYYSGIHPYTGEEVYTPRTDKEKLAQRQYFFWYKPECRHDIIKSLKRIRHPEMIELLFPYNVPRPHRSAQEPHSKGKIQNANKSYTKKQNNKNGNYRASSNKNHSKSQH